MKTAAQSKNGTNRIAAIEAPATPKEVVKVTRPKMRTVAIRIVGTAPYLQCRFAQKAIDKIRAKHVAGDTQTTGKKPKRPPRNFDEDFLGAIHRIDKKTFGIPASAFRAAAISACRLVGYKMTIAKLAIFVEADGYDEVDQMPLVKINGTPERHEMMGRNADGSTDIRVRAIYRQWSAVVRVRWDEDQFSGTDVFNLFTRVGFQIGVGEGRPDSRNSAGMGMGLFAVELPDAA